jgi:hypothetical protein
MRRAAAASGGSSDAGNLCQPPSTPTQCRVSRPRFPRARATDTTQRSSTDVAARGGGADQSTDGWISGQSFLDGPIGLVTKRVTMNATTAASTLVRMVLQVCASSSNTRSRWPRPGDPHRCSLVGLTSVGTSYGASDGLRPCCHRSPCSATIHALCHALDHCVKLAWLRAGVQHHSTWCLQRSL